MQLIAKSFLCITSALFITTVSSPVTAAAAAAPVTPPLTATVSRTNYGMNVFSYDSQMNQPSTVTGISQLGLGMQQFPNANEWSWTTNTFRHGGTAPVSLADWGRILEQTHNHGLFIFDYDENPTFTGGGTPRDAAQLTQYIVAHHLPITAIVVGSEEYGAWDHYANLNPSFSAQYYATQTAAIAQAIHHVDPSMKVGVSFELGQRPGDLTWDQTVLRTDGPYINFVSIHDYPNAEPLSNAQLLDALPQEIAQAMTFVKNELAANVPSSDASQIQTWVTEYNPYGEPGPQSTQNIYGAAMVESAMLWRVDGASKLFVWSYDGQAHRPNAQWPVDTTAGTPYGLFALAGDGQAPELPDNQLYPSGLALEQYMQAIGSGGTLSVWMTAHTVVGQVQARSGASHVFAINTSNTPQTLDLSNGPLRISAASMATRAGQFTLAQPSSSPSVRPLTSSPAPTSHLGYQSTLPTIIGPLAAFPGQLVTVTGTGFNTQQSHSTVIVSQDGINYGGPGDSYGVSIRSWSPTRITFVVPNGSSGPALSPGPATVQIEDENQLVSNIATLTVHAAPQLSVSVPNTAYPGEKLTITGANFGNTQGTGYVMFSQNGVNYGAPPDAYKVTIAQWTNNAITVHVPSGTSGPALAVGRAWLKVVTLSGEASPPIPLTISPPPMIPATLQGANVAPGDVVTITGTGFGSAQGQGYALIQENGVNYGAPSDWYGVNVLEWSNSRIMLRIPQAGMSPTGHEEPSLPPGVATLTLVTSDGLHSEPLVMTVK